MDIKHMLVMEVVVMVVVVIDLGLLLLKKFVLIKHNAVA